MDPLAAAVERAASLTAIGNQIRVTKYAALGLYAAMVYDHVLTLSDEIEFVWKRQFTIVTFLFFMTRYYSLLVLSIVIMAYFSTLFSPQICSRFAPFLPIAVGIPLTFFPAIMMGIRVFALFRHNKPIGLFLAAYLLTEFIVKLWITFSPGSHALPLPQDVRHIDAFVICISIGPDAAGIGFAKSALFQFMQTAYDTIVFVLVLYGTSRIARDSQQSIISRSRKHDLINVIAAQGIMYYAVTFSANFAWAMMIVLAPAGIKYIMAMPTLTLNCIAINRITLGLRGLGDTTVISEGSTSHTPWYTSVEYVRAHVLSDEIYGQKSNSTEVYEMSAVSRRL